MALSPTIINLADQLERAVDKEETCRCKALFCSHVERALELAKKLGNIIVNEQIKQPTVSRKLPRRKRI